MYNPNRAKHTIKRDHGGFSILADGFPLWKGITAEAVRALSAKLFGPERDLLDKRLAQLLKG